MEEKEEKYLVTIYQCREEYLEGTSGNITLLLDIIEAHEIVFQMANYNKIVVIENPRVR